MDWEYEHCAGWQQKAMSDEWGDYSNVSTNESYFWTNGFGSCFSCHCKFSILTSAYKLKML